jgi:hypothetical protein
MYRKAKTLPPRFPSHLTPVSFMPPSLLLSAYTSIIFPSPFYSIPSFPFTRPPTPILREDPSRCVWHRGHLPLLLTENPAAFRNKIHHYASSVEPGDFETFAENLVQSRLNFSISPHTDTLCEILITGDLLRIDGLYGTETSLFMSFAIRFVKGVTVSGEGLQGHLTVFDALVKR